MYYIYFEHISIHGSDFVYLELKENVCIQSHCNTQQHTATHCNTLQHTARHCNTLQHAVRDLIQSRRKVDIQKRLCQISI